MRLEKMPTRFGSIGCRNGEEEMHGGDHCDVVVPIESGAVLEII